MTGWESVAGSSVSTTTYFGGQYLNRITSLLTGTDIATGDATLKPIIGTDFTFKAAKLYVQSTDTTHTAQITNSATANKTIDLAASLNQNGGLATITTDGTTTSFTIAHGLGKAPTCVSVTPQTQDARGNFLVTVDATNITVKYAVAPPTGSNNLWWIAMTTW